MPERPLEMVSLMARNLRPVYRALAAHMVRDGLEVRFPEEESWEECRRRLLAGEAQLGAVCGAHYVVHVDRPDPEWELVATPVPAGPRYAQRPVYFTDVVVREDDPARSFEDLRGRSFAFNEPSSHSGYCVVCWHLASLGAGREFFGAVREAGAHRESARLVAEGEVDAAGLDSTVLDFLREEEPGAVRGLRVLCSLGPSPAPPLVVRRDLDPERRARVRERALGLHRDPEGARALAAAGFLRLAPVEDGDYDRLRAMCREGRQVSLARLPVEVRPPRRDEVARIGAVLRDAFEGDAEAELVRALGDEVPEERLISLAAEVGGELVGHLLLSPLDLGEGAPGTLAALAPVGVRGAFQGRGVGRALVEAGLEAAREAGYRAVVVLGEPDYYRRFGFSPASETGLEGPFPPGAPLQVLELVPGALDGLAGRLVYPLAFGLGS